MVVDYWANRHWDDPKLQHDLSVNPDFEKDLADFERGVTDWEPA